MRRAGVAGVIGSIIGLSGKYILTELYQFDSWSVLVGYILGLLVGAIIVFIVR